MRIPEPLGPVGPDGPDGPTEPTVTVHVIEPTDGSVFPVGADFAVAGTATASGPGFSSVEAVTVRVGSGPLVAAVVSPTAARTARFRATVRLGDAGTFAVLVSAVDGEGVGGAHRLNVSSEGFSNCQDGLLWQNYPRTLSENPHRTCSPGNLAALTEVIVDAEAEGRRVHAFGSRWSFSDCAYVDDVAVSTRQLSKPLQTVQAALLPTAPASLVHVEAGIRLRELYLWLDSQGLALETVGGAAGQTLAGAISTGTDGGDKALPALGDSVLAIHLVGAGGIQYWIEPSQGITDPVRLRASVTPGVAVENVIHDDDVFDAALVSLGAFGIVYSLVLRVRPAYDLVETTTETTWPMFRDSPATWLDDPSIRFVQMLVSPYKNPDGQNSAWITTRAEAPATGPAGRPAGDTKTAVTDAVKDMNFFHQLYIATHFAEDPALPPEQNLAHLVELVRSQFPEELLVLARPSCGRSGRRPPGGAPVYSVMDIGAASAIPAQQPGLSFELAFPARTAQGRLGVESFVESVSNIISGATPGTFFVGYVSLRFSSGTRALIGGLQWPTICSIEVSVAQGVQGQDELMGRLYREGVRQGGVPHWGQLIDLGITGEASGFAGSTTRQQVYGRFSAGFSRRTFENALTTRWGLTDPVTPRSPPARCPPRSLALEDSRYRSELSVMPTTVRVSLVSGRPDSCLRLTPKLGVLAVDLSSVRRRSTSWCWPGERDLIGA